MALEDYRAEMERCSSCSYCKWIPFDQMKSVRFSRGCPSIAYSNFNSYSARGRYTVARSLLEGQSTYTDKVRDIVFKCTACGSCDVSCKICRYNLEPLEMMREFRCRLVEDGQDLPQHGKYLEYLRKEGNMVLQPKNKRSSWAEGLGIKNIKSEPAEVLFYAGCLMSYDNALQQVARTAVSIMKKAGVDIGILGEDEGCCGTKAYHMGHKDKLLKCAESLGETIEKAGVKTVVTACSDCFHAFNRLYPPLGVKFEVLHTVQYLSGLIKAGELKLKNGVPLRVTYHDPCHLGRQGEPYVPWNGVEKKIYNQIVVYDPPKPRYNGAHGIYDEPRDILASIPGIELVEMERIREYAWCCGAGGGARENFPEFSAWTALDRIEEAKCTGADAIVSACGWCERNFIDAIRASGDKMKVFDILKLIQQAI